MDLNDDWEFIIPLTKEDLLKSTSGQYSVENLIDWKTCLSSLKGWYSYKTSEQYNKGEVD